MNWHLISFKSPDGFILNGIIASPNNPKAIFLYVHGLTSSFTSGYEILDTLKRKLEPLQIGVMAFNNRGYGLVNRFKKRDLRKKKGYRTEIIGGVYEKFENCQHDIEGAVNFITTEFQKTKSVLRLDSRNNGHDRSKTETRLCDVIVCGISTGANKSVYYLSKKPNKRVSGLILLSPGSDIEAFGENPKVLEKYRENAQKLIGLGKPDELLEKVDDQFPFSAKRMASLVNTEAPENTFPYIDSKPNFKLFSKIIQPVLVIYGKDDEYIKFDKKKALAIFKSQAKKAYSFSSNIIRGAGHGFDGYEKELSEHISHWISSEFRR